MMNQEPRAPESSHHGLVGEKGKKHQGCVWTINVLLLLLEKNGRTQA